MSAEKKTVRVRITARQEVRYDQEHDIDVDDFKAYQRACKQERISDREIDMAVGGYIDTRDVCDVGELEDVEVERIT